jgi:O-antigen ligase
MRTVSRTPVQSRPELWLWAILLIGSIIALFDGARRPFTISEEITSLTYVASKWALFLAVATLPLCIGYARSRSLTVVEGVLCWFALNTAAYAKDFAYLRVPFAPIFVTDIVLTYACASVLWVPRATPNWSRIGLFSLFLLAGVVALLRGLFREQEMIYVLRDFAIPVYALFAIATALVVRSWRSVRCLMMSVAIGAALSAVSGLAWLAMEPGQRRYIAYGVYVLSGLLGTLLAVINRKVPARIGWPLAIALAIGVLLANARTIFVALIAAIALVVVVGVSMNRRESHRARVRVLAALGGTALIVILAAAVTSAGQEMMTRATSELISGVMESDNDANAQFRLLAWEEAVDRFRAEPILGEGFGVPFIFERSGFDVRPHNTYLTVLYKMGILGAGPLLLLVGGFQLHGWRMLRRHRDAPESVWLYIILLAHLTTGMFGALNLMLESPFLSSMFWMTAGLGYRAIELLRAAEAVEQADAPRRFRPLARFDAAAAPV